LTDTKVFLSKNFEIKNIEDVSFVLDIKIYCNRSKRILGLSQKTYINKVLERFNMKSCSPILAVIMKSDKLTINQSLTKAVEQKQMKNISHASVVRWLLYAQTYTHFDPSFVVGMLARYQSNPIMKHWKLQRKWCTINLMNKRSSTHL